MDICMSLFVLIFLVIITFYRHSLFEELYNHEVRTKKFDAAGEIALEKLGNRRSAIQCYVDAGDWVKAGVLLAQEERAFMKASFINALVGRNSSVTVKPSSGLKAEVHNTIIEKLKTSTEPEAQKAQVDLESLSELGCFADSRVAGFFLMLYLLDVPIEERVLNSSPMQQTFEKLKPTLMEYFEEPLRKSLDGLIDSVKDVCIGVPSTYPTAVLSFFEVKNFRILSADATPFVVGLNVLVSPEKDGQTNRAPPQIRKMD